jgi:hypothetical protein
MVDVSTSPLAHSNAPFRLLMHIGGPSLSPAGDTANCDKVAKRFATLISEFPALDRFTRHGRIVGRRRRLIRNGLRSHRTAVGGGSAIQRKAPALSLPDSGRLRLRFVSTLEPPWTAGFFGVPSACCDEDGELSSPLAYPATTEYELHMH